MGKLVGKADEIWRTCDYIVEVDGGQHCHCGGWEGSVFVR